MPYEAKNTSNKRKLQTSFYCDFSGKKKKQTKKKTKKQQAHNVETMLINVSWLWINAESALFAGYKGLICRLLAHMDDKMWDALGSNVQSIVSLPSSLVVKMLTVGTISNSQVFFLKKNVSSFCKCKSYSHFSAKILAYMPYLMIKILTIR